MKTAYRYQPRHTATRAPQAAPDKGIIQMDRTIRRQAEDASISHLARLYSYGARHGLPNIDSAEYMDRLTLLTMAREEELLLADKIEAELSRPSILKECDW